ncbi:Alpha-2-macroglobulin [Araneus ventricosus]|uniref:Alpha-2-macroglobulin n=1 Tax=Araneus ventricosus TaxID=182803 RepID=A0A4Y2TV32_ARAVE|nr:Alpha-2-macroglobulin [Araneus ventricosus]
MSYISGFKVVKEKLRYVSRMRRKTLFTKNAHNSSNIQNFFSKVLQNASLTYCHLFCSHTYWESPTGEGGSKSVNIETAGYYILSRTKLDGKESVTAVLPVVRWIIQQRNAQGGFVSTQDTVIALQALAQYSALQSSNPLDIGLVVESDELVQGFKVDDDNKLLTQTARIPVLPAVVDLQAVGDGCALLQFSMRYNVERVSGSEALHLSVGAVRLGSSVCNLPRIDICMRYKIPDQKTNMAVVSVKMPSGFVPDEWSLYELQSDTEVQLKRHELDGNRVNLYFNEVTFPFCMHSREIFRFNNKKTHQPLNFKRK